MKLKFTSFLILLFSISNINAQIFFTESFDGTGCAAGSGCDPSIVLWTVVSQGGEGTEANVWYVSDTESGITPPGCGAGGAGDQSLHMGNVSTSTTAILTCPTGDCGANYDDVGPGQITNTRVESPVIDCSGQSNITADFNYIEGGDAAIDDCTFWYFDGSTWANIDAMAKTPTATCNPQGEWTAITTINLPASADNNPNVQIGFLWVSNGDSSTTPLSVAINDVYLTSNPPVGINQIANNNLTSVYPNPTNGIVTISNGIEINKIQILSTSGQVVFEDKMKSAKKTTIDIAELSTGIYFLKVYDKDGFSIQKITKE